MKKNIPSLLILGSLLLGSCSLFDKITNNQVSSANNGSTSEHIDSDTGTSSDTDSTTSTSSDTSSSDTSSSSEIERNWTAEQIELFNKYLRGYILPSLPIAPCKMVYWAGLETIDIETEDYPGIADLYAEILLEDGFEVTYHESNFYTAEKVINDDEKISLEFIEFTPEDDGGFQLTAQIKKVSKPREDVWNSEELKMFSDHLYNVVLPFPDTTNVSMFYREYPDDRYIHITGNYTDNVLTDYLAKLSNEGFTLSKHLEYGIDVARKQLSNNTYVELWVAIANETASSSKFFEIFGRTHQGTFKVIDEKHISFGSYPQTEIRTFSTLGHKIMSEVGELPVSGDLREWSIFEDYYEDGVKQDYGYYKDVTYEGIKYRAIYSTRARTIDVYEPFDEPYRQVLINGYNINKVYLFRYDPIIWEVLEDNDGAKTLAPTYVLDQNYFSLRDTMEVIDEKNIYPSNYQYSFLRNWLNSTFYNLAFNESEKARINTTLVDNSFEQNMASQTEIDDLVYLDSDYHDYICENTNDKVFLFSRKEIVDFDFGYGDVENWNHVDYYKALKPATDYCAARGALISKTNPYEFRRSTVFFLRTPWICDYYGNDSHLGGTTNGLNMKSSTSTNSLGVYPGIKISA